MMKLLFFYTPWCSVCKFYEKEFIEPLKKRVSKDKIEYIDMQARPQMADKYLINRLPSVVILDDDKIKSVITGAFDVEAMTDLLSK